MLEGSCIICKGDTLSSIETRTYKLACHHLILAVILGRVSRCPQSRRNPFRAREDFEPSELWWEILPSSLHSSNRFLWIFSKRRSISTTLLISYISSRIDFEISDKRNNNSRRHFRRMIDSGFLMKGREITVEFLTTAIRSTILLRIPCSLDTKRMLQKLAPYGLYYSRLRFKVSTSTKYLGLDRTCTLILPLLPPPLIVEHSRFLFLFFALYGIRVEHRLKRDFLARNNGDFELFPLRIIRPLEIVPYLFSIAESAGWISV